MNQKLPWHKPMIQLLDARATAQPDIDAAHVDINNNGDISSLESVQGETHTYFGRAHPRFDSAP